MLEYVGTNGAFIFDAVRSGLFLYGEDALLPLSVEAPVWEFRSTSILTNLSFSLQTIFNATIPSSTTLSSSSVITTLTFPKLPLMLFSTSHSVSDLSGQAAFSLYWIYLARFHDVDGAFTECFLGYFYSYDLVSYSDSVSTQSSASLSVLRFKPLVSGLNGSLTLEFLTKLFFFYDSSTSVSFSVLANVSVFDVWFSL